MLLAVGKRLEADALIDNATMDATGLYRGDGLSGLVENLHLIYSLTVGTPELGGQGSHHHARPEVCCA
jgi:hypothetical protein